MATKTGQTGYDYPSMLHAATTFEECITSHPREDQQCSVECFLMRALRECLKESNKKIALIMSIYSNRSSGKALGMWTLAFLLVIMLLY